MNKKAQENWRRLLDPGWEDKANLCKKDTLNYGLPQRISRLLLKERSRRVVT